MTTVELGKSRTVNPSTQGEAEGYDWVTVERLRQRLDAGWLIRDLNGYLFPEDRLGQCGVPRSSEVMAGRRPDGRVQISDIATCGSVSGCVRCASIIRAARAEEIDFWAKAHLARGGGCLVFLTFTLPHTAADRLEQLLAAMKGKRRPGGKRKLPGAWDRVISGRGWLEIKDRFQVLGQIRADEVTYGVNGWHPHIHVLFFLDRPPLNEEEMEEFRARLGQRWGAHIAAELGRDIHGIYGVDAGPVTDLDGVGEYVSKIHFEMVRGDLKQRRQDTLKGGGRTPWQVGVDGVRTGDAADIARWREYVTAMKGQKILGVSKAIRDRYGSPSTAERSDQDLAAETQDTTEEVAISNDVFGTARRSRIDGESVIARAIIALEDHGITAMAARLEADLDRPVRVERRLGAVPLIQFGPGRSARITARLNRQA